MSTAKAIPVSQLVHYLKSKMEQDLFIQNILVEGEISNYSSYRSGHWYFTLKDEVSSMRCVMFASANKTVTFTPKNGDKVLVKGDVSVYDKDGQLQLICTGMRQNGLGDLYLQYEALKKKLSAEGLFDESHKKPIPPYPFEIALVTGKNTAARSDVLTTMQRRWPIAHLTEYPVLVQGTESAKQIIEALKKADSKGYDVILLVRGGGSIEDLWSFNDEQLARTIYALKTPIITGVGHEVDTTIVDYVSDLRAPTPTGAAEQCCPNLIDVKENIHHYQMRLIQNMQAILQNSRATWKQQASQSCFTSPEKIYREKQLNLSILEQKLFASKQVFNVYRQHLQELSQQFTQCIHQTSSQVQQKTANAKNRLWTILQTNQKDRHAHLATVDVRLTNVIAKIQNDKKQQLTKQMQLLDAYSPLKVLDRGYSVLQKDGVVIKSTDELKLQDEVSIRLSKGKAYATIQRLEKEK